MKEEINKNDLQRFNRDGSIFSMLLVVLVVSVVPLAVFFVIYGLGITGILFVISMYFAMKIEKYKKESYSFFYSNIFKYTIG